MISKPAGGTGAIYDFFTSDHRRIEAIFAQATAGDAVNGVGVDMERYNAFRVGLLTHIKMEEKILFLAAQQANGGVPLPLQAKLRLDHGALTALVVCYPSPEVQKVLLHIMERHDLLEEQKGGMYEACERLTETELERILTALKEVTPVPVHPVKDAPYIFEVAKRAVSRAGFDYDLIVQRDVP